MSGLDLNKLEEKLNNALSNETSESLNNWLEQKRMSNNKQIPTALEFLHRDESGVFNEVDITQAMIDFAKLHVTAALKAAADDYSEGSSDIVHKSIINAYPFSNIQ